MDQKSTKNPKKLVCGKLKSELFYKKLSTYFKFRIGILQSKSWAHPQRGCDLSIIT